eukprot:scaffold27848_cov36-Tisochrysis_lutea.AAC.2
MTNSPILWPTILAATLMRLNSLPLWTRKVLPIISSVIVALRSPRIGRESLGGGRKGDILY